MRRQVGESSLLIHGCACHGPGYLAAQRRQILRVSDLRTAGPSPLARPAGLTVIDLHNHVMAPEVEALIADHPEKRRLQALQAPASPASQASDRQLFLDSVPRMTIAANRIADMDAMGVDIQVLSPSPTQYCYWADPDLSARLVTIQNECVIQFCREHPERFLGFGAVSLQHPDLAADQVREVMAHSEMKGVQISTMAGGRELADPGLETFWTACEATRAVVFIHPLGTSLGPRFDPFYLSNTAGHPIETTLALSKLILGGVLDRHPRLLICAAHGGGYLPMYFGRADHAWLVQEDAHSCARQPSDYLRSLYFDSLVFASQQLRGLADSVGYSQIVLGTDYPFDMGSYEPLALTAEPLFSAEEQAAILGGNARRLLGLDPASSGARSTH